MKKGNQVLLLLLAVYGLVACDNAQEPMSQTLEERVMSRWTSVLDRDFSGVWTYQTPGFREITTVEAFVAEMERRPVRWLDAELQSLDCEDNRCEVVVSATYRPVGAPPPANQMTLTRPVEEIWIRLDGQWWHSDA